MLQFFKRYPVQSMVAIAATAALLISFGLLIISNQRLSNEVKRLQTQELQTPRAGDVGARPEVRVTPGADPEIYYLECFYGNKQSGYSPSALYSNQVMVKRGAPPPECAATYSGLPYVSGGANRIH